MVSITSVSINQTLSTPSSKTATTSGSLQTATAALLQALQDEGSTTTGSMVSTSA
ncbi:hypothetical protein QN400_01380 [Pseudomonas sp. RTC3]|uniref:hypothetical protein n=1 Tax=unclassified Pseudomonas TaxID=196821 RepID=UPI002AB33710|nr:MULTISPECIES: hypothetical protein [unclassified Pseudomonas]MEB0060684.1 hypothetical protein [Pseudomonas sp. RTC3]MDY7564669.1 hypothetical protein [Pseudomonas sp. 5C2]MEB0006638.1 hypothetical protein [Pseudomonas sp. RTB2]MEB0015976.1 hypothetical protein [Pseudomonas sp. RTB3]MEB0025952.1 hypothetical protein [Pseudomonas sp. MH9.2]